MEERPGRTWLLYALLPLGTSLLLLACVCLLCFLRRIQGGLQFPFALYATQLEFLFLGPIHFQLVIVFFLARNARGTTGFQQKTEWIDLGSHQTWSSILTTPQCQPRVVAKHTPGWNFLILYTPILTVYRRHSPKVQPSQRTGCSHLWNQHV